jgi:apolipoprotein N-acyltransferase
MLMGSLALTNKLTLILLALPVFLFIRSPSRGVFVYRLIAFNLGLSLDVGLGMKLVNPGQSYMPLFGIALMTALLSAPWLILWKPAPGPLRTGMALLLCALPPYNYLVPATPISLIGLGFPGMSFTGIIMCITAISTCTILHIRICRALVGLTVVTMIIANILYSPKPVPKQWRAITTQEGENRAFGSDYLRTRVITQTAANLAEADVLVFPETFITGMTPGVIEALRPTVEQAERRSQTLIIGALDQRQNLAVIAGHDAADIIARQPVPFIFWRPWNTANHMQGAPMTTAVTDIKGHRVAVLICWEEWVPGPLWLSMLQQPDVVISLSNHGWAKGSKRLWQHQSNLAWVHSRLFGLIPLRAVNF